MKVEFKGVHVRMLRVDGRGESTVMSHVTFSIMPLNMFMRMISDKIPLLFDVFLSMSVENGGHDVQFMRKMSSQQTDSF